MDIIGWGGIVVRQMFPDLIQQSNTKGEIMTPNTTAHRALGFHLAEISQDLLRLRDSLDAPLRAQPAYLEAVACFRNGLAALQRAKSDLEAGAMGEAAPGDLVGGELITSRPGNVSC